MLLSLNDDCLRIIIEMLNLEDQISCAFSCQCLKNFITEIWQSKKYFCIDMRNLRDIPLEYVVECMKCIRDSAEDLQLVEIDLNHLKNTKFPKVHSLEYLNYENHPTDGEKLIKDLFPNLTKLRLYGDFIGNHLRNLTNLETLELYHCDNLQTKFLKNINSKLTKIKKFSIDFTQFSPPTDFMEKILLCKTLEEFSIDEYTFLMIYEELFKLENLKKITCFFYEGIESLLTRLTYKFGNVLHTIEISGYDILSNSSICQTLQKFIALRKLIFCDTRIYGSQFHTIAASCSPALEEFHYRNVYLPNSEPNSGLLEIVRRYKKLKILDLSDSNIDENFVKELAAIIASDNKKRNQVLVMNCSRTKVKIGFLKTFQLPEKLQISFKYKEVERPYEGPGSLSFEWNTADGNN